MADFDDRFNFRLPHFASLGEMESSEIAMFGYPVAMLRERCLSFNLHGFFNDVLVIGSRRRDEHSICFEIDVPTQLQKIAND